MTATLLHGDARATLAQLETGSVRCCVTSPPYWGLRDYGEPDQLGLERTPEEYVARLVGVFEEVRRVLADDGTLWLNLGDSYAATTKGSGGHNPKQDSNTGSWMDDRRHAIPIGLKPKDLVGIPWRVAFALQAAGWYLRSDIIWAKPNPMPESVTDRPTKAHEYLFLLSKSERYYYNAKAIAEPATCFDQPAGYAGYGARALAMGREPSGNERPEMRGMRRTSESRNRRTVWTIATTPYSGAHFAVMPEALVEPCVMAGSAPGDTILDPFCGSGTVGVVALRAGRRFVGIDLNAAYLDLARERLRPWLVQERLAL